MQFLTLFAAALSTFATFAAAAPSDYNADAVYSADAVQNVRVGYSLDLNPNTSIRNLACSATFARLYPNFHVLGDLPTAAFYGQFPGAVDPSQLCGSCWQLQNSNQATFYMIAVDNAGIIQLSGPEFNRFAGAQAPQGTVNATVAPASLASCGLSGQ